MNALTPLARVRTSICALSAFAAVALLVPTVSAASETVTVAAQEDTYGSSKYPSTNYGSASEFGVDGSPTEIAYLKFDLSAYGGRTLEGASLKLRSGSSGSSGKQNVKFVSSDSWSESTLTYDNRPALGTALGIIGPTSTNTNYTVTLDASGIASDLGGILSLGMDSAGSTDGLNVTSSETTTGPKLVLTLADSGSTDTTAPTITSVSPSSGATGVAVGSNVTATFSEAMDPGTISSTTVKLADGSGNAVNATVAYDSTAKSVTLDPAADLAAGATYTATVKGGSTGVKDAAGNPLANDQVWSFSTQAASTGTETVTVAAQEDTYVSSNYPSTNYGSRAVLAVDAKPIEISYLKFDLSPYSGRTLESAVLQVRSVDGSAGKQNVKLVTNDAWSESGLTYDNRPALGSTLGGVGPTSDNTNYSVALSAAGVASDLGGKLSLGLDSSSTDGLDLNSRETNTGPKLVLTFGEASTTGGDPVIAAAGDIACDPADSSYNGGSGTTTNCRQKATSDLVAGQNLAQVLTLGDHQYEDDQYAKYLEVFDPTWGRVKELIRPAIGNREYRTTGAAGYFDYFNGSGEQTGPAGDRSKGYYSYDIGAWHVIALNSNCSIVSCATGSAQEQWLRADLAANPGSCTLAYLHHPRFTSGSAGNNTSVQPLWQALYEAGADVVLAAHAHGYERFARQTPSGTADTTRGIRQFVVGTGGKSLQSFSTTAPNTEVRDNTTYGVMRMSLRPTSYDWTFVPEAGKSFSDSGSQACH